MWLTGVVGPTGAEDAVGRVVIGGGMVVGGGALVGLISKADTNGFGAVPKCVIRRPADGLLVLLPYRMWKLPSRL